MWFYPGWTLTRFYHYRLDVIQNRIIRIIIHSKYNAQTMPLFRALNLLTITDLFNLNCLKFVYKFKNKKSPLYCLDFECVPRSEIHDHDKAYVHSIDSETTRTVMRNACVIIADIIDESPRIIMEKIVIVLTASYSLPNAAIWKDTDKFCVWAYVMTHACSRVHRCIVISYCMVCVCAWWSTREYVCVFTYVWNQWDHSNKM